MRTAWAKYLIATALCAVGSQLLAQTPYAMSGWYKSASGVKPALDIHVTADAGSLFVDSAQFSADQFRIHFNDGFTFCARYDYSDWTVVFAPPVAIEDDCFSSPYVPKGISVLRGTYAVRGCFVSPDTLHARFVMYYDAGCADSTAILRLVNPAGVTGAADGRSSGGASYRLLQSYPNPLNGTASIRYGLSRRSVVTVHVYDVLGSIVATLLEGVIQEPGDHLLQWDPSRQTSGVYFYQLQVSGLDDLSGQRVLTRKLLVIK